MRGPRRVESDGYDIETVATDLSSLTAAACLPNNRLDLRRTPEPNLSLRPLEKSGNSGNQDRVSQRPRHDLQVRN